jgi:hypothetical protein
MVWYEKFGFEEDPYRIVDPMTLPANRIKWNRDDLADKWQFQDFIDRVCNGYRVGLKIFGPIGSGKTWILRCLQESILARERNAIIIYTKLPRPSPTISTLYEYFLKSIKPKLSPILKIVDKKSGPTIDDWRNFIPNRDLATCLWYIYHKEEGDMERLACEMWLAGERLSLTERKKVKIISTLDADHRKVDTIRNFLELSHLAFSTCVLMVDEMENAPVAIARPIGDSLRDLLDSFYERFALVCSYTAERAAEELLDLGYGEYLYSRLERSLSLMEPIRPEHLINLLRIHNQRYRKSGLRIEDELHPFTEEAINKLLSLMVEVRRFPRYIMDCCGIIASTAAAQGLDKITEDFILKVKNMLPIDVIATR